MSDYEVRFTTGVIAYRALPDSAGPGVLAGYASVYNKWSRDLGGFIEQVAPSAFRKSLSDGANVLARYNHSDSALLGRTSSGTLRLGAAVQGYDVNTGLPYEVDLPDTTSGRDVAELARRGDITQSSFAFRTIKDSWDVNDAGVAQRTLLEVALVDVAPVIEPAYPDATAGMRSLAHALGADVDTVREYAERHDLVSLIKELPVEGRDAAVDEDEQNDEPVDTPDHSTPLLAARRRALLLKRRP